MDELLGVLTGEGLLSDRRFTESYLQSRIGRGWGPLRIRAGLRERGVGGDLIDACVDINAEEWQDRVRAVHAKRFGGRPATRFQDRAKQARYLQSRGFTAEQISAVLGRGGDGEP